MHHSPFDVGRFRVELGGYPTPFKHLDKNVIHDMF